MAKLNEYEDLSERVFGKLKVLRFSGRKGKNRNVYWECLCECGRIKDIRASHLKSGGSNSCGCTLAEVGKRNFLDLKSERFGKLIVKKLKDKTKWGNYTWECLCDCGNVCVVASGHLTTGHTVSCGCSLESIIAKELKEYFEKHYFAEKEYKICINPKTGRKLPYDIYLPNEKIFIEINGSQHYEFSKHWHKNKEGFEYLKRKDRIKRKFARKNGKYIEIDLRKIKTSEEAINYINGFL